MGQRRGVIPAAAAVAIVALGALARPRPRTGRPARPARLAPAWLGPALARAGIDKDPEVVVRGWGAGGVAAGLAAALVVGAPGGLAATVLVALGSVAALVALRHRGDDQLEQSLPALLEVVAGELRSGASLVQGLQAASRQPGRLASELAELLGRVGRGGTLTAELEGWAQRRALPGLRLAVTALVLGAETGGVRGKAVDGVAETLRDRLALRREVAALSSQAQASALVMTLTPLAFAVLAAGSDRRSAAFLVRSPIGLACLVLGVALDLVAGWWMLRMTRSAA